MINKLMNTAIFCESLEHSKEIEEFYLANNEGVHCLGSYIEGEFNFICLDNYNYSEVIDLCYIRGTYGDIYNIKVLTLSEAKNLVEGEYPDSDNSELIEYINSKIKELTPNKRDYVDSVKYFGMLQQFTPEINILKKVLEVLKKK